jgi:hypothetical protein
VDAMPYLCPKAPQQKGTPSVERPGRKPEKQQLKHSPNGPRHSITQRKSWSNVRIYINGTCIHFENLKLYRSLHSKLRIMIVTNQTSPNEFLKAVFAKAYQPGRANLLKVQLIVLNKLLFIS